MDSARSVGLWHGLTAKVPSESSESTALGSRSKPQFVCSVPTDEQQLDAEPGNPLRPVRSYKPQAAFSRQFSFRRLAAHDRSTRRTGSVQDGSARW